MFKHKAKLTKQELTKQELQKFSYGISLVVIKEVISNC